MPQTKLSPDPHVAVLAFPFAAHAAALLTIIRRLSTSLPNVHFSFLNTSKSNRSIFSPSENEKTEVTTLKAYDVWDGVPENYVFVGKHQEDIDLFMKVAPESFRKGIEAAVAEIGRPVSCLVSDAFLWFAADLAEELGVPWVPSWTSGACSLSSHAYTDAIRERFGIIEGNKSREDETLDFIPGMSKVQIRDLPEGIVFGNVESSFSHMLHQMGLKLPHATAVFSNSFEELEPTISNDLKSKFNDFLSVGPFNLTSPPPPAPDVYGCISWLNKQNLASVAYISFGSVAVPPPHELVAIAEALQDSKVPFLWSLKENHKAHLPNGFLEKTKEQGIIVPWAPQLDVLGHKGVGVFVTHCGWNSLLENINGGVPMICRPFFGDHRLNGRMIEDVWEIGVKVEGGVFTKDGLLRCFDLVLFQEKGEKMRGKIKQLKLLVEKVVGPKGSSTQNFNRLVEIVSKDRA